MAEVSLKNIQEFPVVVLRPSVVPACYKEPFAGWVDNLLGPTALIATHGKGIVHTFLCRLDIPIDTMPADLVVNAVIAAGWRSAISKPKEHLIYNVTTSNKNPLSWRSVVMLGNEMIKRYPFENMLWYPTKHFGENKFIYNIYVTLAHNIPAHIVDFLFKLSGRKPL
ncbi:putative fatty acyl-CoA reductase CG5065 [Chironomus tepperi]|uniref:putative fatty acyl-CoA reductase CG5065 n=1 Tax=Chironomus tepperi TaxID=113505 RepID=UPI00391F7FC5